MNQLIKPYVLFINPPLQRIIYKKVRPYVPYGLLYIATFLQSNGIRSRVYNADLEKPDNIQNNKDEIWNEIKKVIETEKPDVVAIGVLTPQHEYALKIASIVKSFDEKIPVILGGVHATFVFEEMIRDVNVDFIVRNEGEETTLELIQKLVENSSFENINGITYIKNGDIVSNPIREPIKNLDAIPFPDRELILDNNFYPKSEFGIIIPCRGCPFNCSFCSSFKYSKYRGRSAKNIVDEIEYIKEKYHIMEFWMEGDNFFINKRELIDFCKELKDRKLKIIWGSMARVDIIDDNTVKEMKSSGLCNISLGIESGSQEILNVINKRITVDQIKKAVKILKKRGIFVNTYWMVGFYEETPDSINQTKNLIKKIKPHLVRTFIMTPFPGSEEFIKAKKMNSLNSNKWTDFHVRNPYLLKRPYISNKIIDKEFNGFFYDLAKKEVKSWMIYLITHPRCLLRKIIEFVYSIKYKSS